MATVGVIGLGQIGAGVARSVQRAGHELLVCDVRPEVVDSFTDIATPAASPAELAGRAEVVVVAVVDDAQVHEVLSGPAGALGTARPGSTIVILSTVSPAAITSAAAAAAEVGVDVVDCGVSGGPGASAKGTLVAMVGGDEGVVERIRPVLDGFSSLAVHMGPLGAGLRAKLARNLIQYGAWMAAYEGQALAEAAGIELAKLAQVIRASDPLIGGITTLMLRDTVAPFGPGDDARFVAAMDTAAGLAHKDLSAALDLADSLGVDLPVTTLTEQRCDRVFGLGASTTEEGAP